MCQCSLFSLPDLTVTKMVEVLKMQIQSGASASRIVALNWIHHLFECSQAKVRDTTDERRGLYEMFSFQMAGHIDGLFPTLFRVLSDASDEVSLRASFFVLHTMARRSQLLHRRAAIRPR
jgi:hypothetical protein